MEQKQLKEIKKELNQIKNDLKSYDFDTKIGESIDYSLFKIHRLLDPRPPKSSINYCSYCGKKLNNDDISGINQNNFLDMS